MASRVELHPDHVIASAERSLRRGLKLIGDEIAADARQSLQHRRRPSRPGETPSIWSSRLQQISATVNERENSVRIAPTGDLRIPDVLEGGGSLNGIAFIEPRPFMWPAARRQMKQHVPGIWQNQLKES